MNTMPFKIGELYAHDFIMMNLKIGNSGGIRVSTNGAKVTRVVLFSTSEQEANPQENPYQDRTEGAVLTYTGTGKIGDQNLSGQNLRITQQNSGYFPIYVFSLFRHRKVAGSPEKRWRFSGIYKYLDHSRENQADLLGSERTAWVFKLLRLNISEADPSIENDLVRIIADAHSDPALSASVVLGSTSFLSATEIGLIVGRMNSLEPVAFESFVKRTLIASRFRDVRVTKKSSDGGIDVVARMPESVWPIETQIIQVQVKRWARPVGRREVAELRGSLMPRAIGVIITTGNYARTAILESDRPNLLPISLVDGYKLAAVAIRLDLEVA